ncbi:MAG: amino acid ABC transporter permease [Clostridia bacterium]|nr:amino acid ABC transporter permease [Clostridia bacterium]
MWNITLNLLSGFGVTCLIFILTLVFALPLGLLIAFGGMSSFKPLSYLIKTIVWVVRGTPLMLQVMVVFYAPAFLLGWSGLQCTAATVVAFVINYACYFSEIYRGGIQSITKGQYEAGQVLGMTKSQIFSKVVLLQVIKRIIAPMSNEIITLVKDTSLARVIATEEILFVAFNRYVSKGIIWPLFYSGAFYLLFVGILTIIFNKLEKKLSYFKA